MDVTRMAWRNVWRNRRRSLITIAAMTLALFSMIVYAGLTEGYLRGMERNVLDLEVGDVQVFAGDYRTNPSIYTLIEDPEDLLGPLVESGFRATPRLLAFGLAAAAEASAGVSLRGLEVERDATVSILHEQLDRGRWLDTDDPGGVVVGRRLARTLGVEPDSDLIVLTQGADGSMAYDRYRVRGVLRGISGVTDRSGIFMTAAAFRELLVLPQGVHQIVVRRPTEVALLEATVQVQKLARELDVKTWRQLLPTIASMMDSARGVIIVMFVIMYVAVAILILNAMLMAVFERIREFGVLKALGVGPFDVLRLILLESAIQTGIAIAGGLVSGALGMVYLVRVGIDLGSFTVMGLAMDPVWRGAVTPGVFAAPVLTLVAIVALAVLYPGFKAALIRPVEAMRHQ